MGIKTGSICLEDLGAIKDKATKAKNGKHYLNIVLIETPNSEYSEYMMARGTSKEERENGVKGESIGQISKWKDNKGGSSNSSSSNSSDDLPF